MGDRNSNQGQWQPCWISWLCCCRPGACSWSWSCCCCCCCCIASMAGWAAVLCVCVAVCRMSVCLIRMSAVRASWMEFGFESESESKSLLAVYRWARSTQNYGSIGLGLARVWACFFCVSFCGPLAAWVMSRWPSLGLPCPSSSSARASSQCTFLLRATYLWTDHTWILQYLTYRMVVSSLHAGIFPFLQRLSRSQVDTTSQKLVDQIQGL